MADKDNAELICSINNVQSRNVIVTLITFYYLLFYFRLFYSDKTIWQKYIWKYFWKFNFNIPSSSPLTFVYKKVNWYMNTLYYNMIIRNVGILKNENQECSFFFIR